MLPAAEYALNPRLVLNPITQSDELEAAVSDIHNSFLRRGTLEDGPAWFSRRVLDSGLTIAEILDQLPAGLNDVSGAGIMIAYVALGDIPVRRLPNVVVPQGLLPHDIVTEFVRHLALKGKLL